MCRNRKEAVRYKEGENRAKTQVLARIAAVMESSIITVHNGSLLPRRPLSTVAAKAYKDTCPQNLGESPE